MKTNTNFKWQGYNFKNIPLVTYNDGLSYFSKMGGVSKVCKQYIKQKYNINVQVATESYSGGNSLRVYIDPLLITPEKYKIIKGDIDALFSYGKFNGMIDSYEYSNSEHIYNEIVIIHNDELIKDKVDFTAKYVFVNHDFKYGTKQYKEYYGGLNDK